MPKLSDLEPKKVSYPVVKQKKKPNQDTIPIITKRRPNLNYRVLLTAINNYLLGYKKTYENAKDNPLSESKLKYEDMLKEKVKVEKLLESED